MPQVSEFSWILIFLSMMLILLMLFSQLKLLFSFSSPNSDLKVKLFVLLI